MDFRPCFDWLEEHGMVPQTLVFLTDLCSSPHGSAELSGDLDCHREEACTVW
jgi:hypothetical protein